MSHAADAAVKSAFNEWVRRTHVRFAPNMGAVDDAFAEWKKLHANEVAAIRANSDVLAERERQKAVEGWTPEHDDAHASKELAHAAACYAIGSRLYNGIDFWPWDDKDWKPKDRRSNLIRAAALILAEIERLDRAAIGDGK